MAKDKPKSIPAANVGTLDLCVLRPTDFNVPEDPGDFGHWQQVRWR